MITRVDVLNYLIKVYDVKNYLEIGVNRGKCFFNIKGAKQRIAVDPYFNFSFIKKIRYLVKNPHNFKNKYFEMTSDRFFDMHHKFLKNNPINLTFIDGLHTFSQSLKDTLNSLKYLSDQGIIILHDCNPQDKIAAFPASNIEDARIKFSSHKSWKNIWNGDVWKTIVFLRKNYPELTVSVLDTDHGLGVVKKIPTQEVLPPIFDSIANEDIPQLEYSFLASHRKELLNLVPIEIFLGKE